MSLGHNDLKTKILKEVLNQMWVDNGLMITSTLTHRDQVMHICISNLTIIGADNGLAPSRRQAINWTSDGILLIGPLGTNFNEILIAIHTFSFKKMHLQNVV